MSDWNVRGYFKCPICGEEMEMTSGAWYYEHEVQVISLECKRCDLYVHEFCSDEYRKEQEPYFDMVKRLRARIRKAGWQEAEGCSI